jgi:hypothetical protein
MNPNPKDSGDKTMHTVVLSRAGMVLASFAWLMPPTVRATELPPLPQTVTSFGAAVTGDALYLYGGHTGRAHHYYHEGQADTLWRLDLKQPNAWEALNEGPGLQGLAMVAHGGKLYRIGGFTARNPEDQDADLWSQAAVACYDPAVGRWQDLTPLPEPRSSFDAAVLDDKVYVIGGWRIAGGRDATWHKTAWTMDLSADSPSWQALPEPCSPERGIPPSGNGSYGQIRHLFFERRFTPVQWQRHCVLPSVFRRPRSGWGGRGSGPAAAGAGVDGLGRFPAEPVGRRQFVAPVAGRVGKPRLADVAGDRPDGAGSGGDRVQPAPGGRAARRMVGVGAGSRPHAAGAHAGGGDAVLAAGLVGTGRRCSAGSGRTTGGVGLRLLLTTALRQRWRSRSAAWRRPSVRFGNVVLACMFVPLLPLPLPGMQLVIEPLDGASRVTLILVGVAAAAFFLWGLRCGPSFARHRPKSGILFGSWKRVESELS